MARAAYVYVVGLNYNNATWMFTVKHEALSAIWRSGYQIRHVTLTRVPGYSYDLCGQEPFGYNVEEELAKMGYVKEKK